MKPQFTSAYLNSLFEPGSYENLVQIASLLTGSTSFDPAKCDFGLGKNAFALVEGLGWFAQSVRSGSWTYFEATPTDRQALMLRVLRDIGLPDFAARYESGIKHWRDAEQMRKLDLWVDHHEDQANRWLWDLVVRNRAEILAIIT